MKAVCWYGANEVRVTVPDPKILNPRRYSQSYINGDLWLGSAYLAATFPVQQGDIMVTSSWEKSSKLVVE